MGLDNRAFITDYNNEVDTNIWTYKDNYLGGSLEFDVDVSRVPCSCATHVYLTEINDNTCSWYGKEARVIAPCASIDLMKANKSGYFS